MIMLENICNASTINIGSESKPKQHYDFSIFYYHFLPFLSYFSMKD
jgi:hypothetical protein